MSLARVRVLWRAAVPPAAEDVVRVRERLEARARELGRERGRVWVVRAHELVVCVHSYRARLRTAHVHYAQRALTSALLGRAPSVKWNIACALGRRPLGHGYSSDDDACVAIHRADAVSAHTCGRRAASATCMTVQSRARNGRSEPFRPSALIYFLAFWSRLDEGAAPFSQVAEPQRMAGSERKVRRLAMLDTTTPTVTCRNPCVQPHFRNASASS